MRRALAAGAAALLLAGCGGGGGATSAPTAAQTTTTRPTTSFRLSSPAFAPGARIPARYTCSGANISPPLHWTGVPPGTKELVLIMRDPDAPGGNFVHWAVAGISPTTSGFAAGAAPGHVNPGRNSFGTLGYSGPCPPRGDPPHRYVISLTALAEPSGLGPGFSTSQFKLTRPASTATLTGTFGRG